jgi:hypothetical protein
MCLQTLIEEARKAEVDDNAEDAYFYHIQISNYYKRVGNDALSRAHRSKANVYREDDDQPRMRFL